MNSNAVITKITYQQFIEASRKNDNVSFSDSSFDFPISIINTFTNSNEINYSFQRCSFKRIEFLNTKFKGKIYFHDCQIEEDFIVNNCVFYGPFMIYYISAKSIRIWNNDFLKRVDVYDFKKVETLILQFRKVMGRVHVKQWHVNRVELKSIHITFEEISECSIHLEDFFSKKIEIQFSGQLLQDSVRLNDFRAEEINIYKLKNKSTNNIDLVRIEANKISFLWLHNDGWLSLRDFKCGLDNKESLFNIQDSYFGNAELYHIDLNSFKKVHIFNCHLQNIIPVNVKWNFNITAYKGIKAEYLRELFRQFKNVCFKNMDKVSQLQFERMEMTFYATQLHWRRNFQDWFILKTNRFSNNHGSNWLLPLMWLLIFSFAFYTAINFVSGCFANYHFGNYLTFVFPLHNINDILCVDPSKINHKNLVRFWDIVQKLFSSYFIFQFLRSFRKYVN